MADERARIAGELHDVVAHALSAMTVQATGARRLALTRPELAREAFGAIETAGREALDELRRLLGVLRRDGRRVDAGAAALAAPRPRSLPAAVTASGLPVRCASRAERELPAGVDVTAYRVVQDALAARRARRRGPRRGAACAFAADRGRGRDPRRRRARGRDCCGIRERVALHGGTPDRAGPAPRAATSSAPRSRSTARRSSRSDCAAIACGRRRLRVPGCAGSSVADAPRAMEVEANGLAAIDERRRIARELHDLVAHSISVMVVQAGGARRILDRDPGARAGGGDADRAHRPRGAGRDAPPARRARRPTPAALAPQPTLAEIGELVARARAAGLPTALEVRGERRAAAGRARPRRVPDRPGGADQRAQARRPRAHDRDRRVVRATRSRSRSATTDAPPRPAATARPRPGGHARARAALRRRAGGRPAPTAAAGACARRSRSTSES